MPYPGQPKDTPIPPNLDRWNWGAFLLNWIWGLGNSTYIALLMFIPLVNIVMIFVLGAKGNHWAWKNRLWADEDHFKRTQRNWSRAGFIIALGMILVFGGLFYGLGNIFKRSEAYELSMRTLRADPQVIAAMGEPLEAGWFVSGSLTWKGGQGMADLSISLSGPNTSGTAISHSIKENGFWRITFLVVRLDGDPTPIVVINEENLRIPNSGTDI
jgi:hypothetical protein